MCTFPPIDNVTQMTYCNNSCLCGHRLNWQEMWKVTWLKVATVAYRGLQFKDLKMTLPAAHKINTLQPNCSHFAPRLFFLYINLPPLAPSLFTPSATVTYHQNQTSLSLSLYLFALYYLPDSSAVKTKSCSLNQGINSRIMADASNGEAELPVLPSLAFSFLRHPHPQNTHRLLHLCLQDWQLPQSSTWQKRQNNTIQHKNSSNRLLLTRKVPAQSIHNTKTLEMFVRKTTYRQFL